MQTNTHHLQPRRFGQRLISSVRALLAVSALAALAVSSPSFAQVPTFNALVTTDKGSPGVAHAGGAAVGDLNGDGKLDSAVYDGTGTIHVLLGNGNGTFAEHRADVPVITDGNAVGLNSAFFPYLPHPIDGVVRAIKAVDVNGDGKLDLVCLFVTHLNFAPLGGATVMINAGNDVSGVPQFTTATHNFFPFEFDVRSLTVGDLNRDGKPDFIVGGAHGGLQIYLNNSDGTFTAGQATAIVPIAGGPAVGPGVIADLNGDSKPDYVVTSNQAGATDVFWGNGDGTLQSSPTVIPGYAFYVAVADVDPDGKPDLILSTTPTTVLLNNGDKTFRTGATLEYGGASVTTTDINGDGILDIVEGYDIVWLGKGDGTFGSGFLFEAKDPNIGNFFIWGDVAVGDFNGDGKPDVFTVGPDNNYVGVLLNTTPAPIPAQLFFTDALTGPSSPNLAAFPAGKYSYTASGLQRSQSNGDTDRPVVATALKTYLASTTGNFAAEIDVNIVNNDIAYFGVGQGDTDPTWNNEPAHAFYFRAHNNFVNGGGGYYGIQADLRGSGSGSLVAHDIGNYTPGSTITLRITRLGDQITMSIVGGGSVTYSLSAHPELGLTDSNTRVFFGNTTVGSTFSNLKIYPILSDTTPPVITAPANMTVEATGPNGAVVSFTATAQDIVDGSVNVTANRPSGSTFPLGTTTVSLTATDAAGNTASASFTITVLDTTPPVILADTTVTAEATSSAGAAVTFVATANDIVSGNVAVTATPASGSTFPIGLSSVSLSATDAAGNTASGKIIVNVRDTIAPALTVPASQVIEATSAAGAVATFAATATDAVGVTSLAYSAASGSTFPIGTTTVSVTAADAAGNSSSGSFTITVRDTTAPAISSLTPSSATLWPPNHKMVPITLTAAASDAVGVASLKIISATSNEPDNGLGDGDTAGDIEITGALTLNLRAERSGSGNGRVYTITVEAKDAAGNASTKTVTVSVPKSQGGK